MDNMRNGKGRLLSILDFINSNPSMDRSKNFKEDSKQKLLMNLEKKIDPLSWILGDDFKKEDFELFEDVGQIYELQLAKMEFDSFKEKMDIFRRRTAYFKKVNGKKSYHYFISNVRGKGQIGHTNQYLTHWFYPYKGKFHGQMIKAIINFMGASDDDIILDPFMGSGTTLIEASVVGTKSFGIEINPALCIVSQIKLDSMKIDYPEFRENITEMDLPRIFKYFNGAKTYLSERKWEIEANNQNAKDILEELWDNHFPDSFVKEYPFRWRNLLLLIYLHALSDYTYLKGTSKEKSLWDFFYLNFEEYSRTIKGTYETFKELDITLGDYTIILGSALDIPLSNNSVKGIVTSPPYSIALDYVKNDLHLLTYLGIDTKKLRNEMVGLKGRKAEKLKLYERDIRKSIEEMYRVLKKGGWASIVLGDVVVNDKRTDFCEKIIRWAPEIGFTDAYAMKRPILGGFARLRYEYVIFLQK
ncbi:MAG: hypothetical protein DRN25_05820 [Thermoplasmata archaeon]|nr:MAG: hypothetical protein DRN25_05820 [Thermoplasmata archaeon]